MVNGLHAMPPKALVLQDFEPIPQYDPANITCSEDETPMAWDSKFCHSGKGVFIQVILN